MGLFQTSGIPQDASRQDGYRYVEFAWTILTLFSKIKAARGLLELRYNMTIKLSNNTSKTRTGHHHLLTANIHSSTTVRAFCRELKSGAKAIAGLSVKKFSGIKSNPIVSEGITGPSSWRVI